MGTVAGSLEEHLSVEDASGCQAALFDEGAGEAVLVFRGLRATASTGQDVKRQRSNHTASLAVENAAARQHRPVRCSALPSIGSVVRDLPEVGPRRQTRVHLRTG